MRIILLAQGITYFVLFLENFQLIRPMVLCLKPRHLTCRLAVFFSFSLDQTNDSSLSLSFSPLVEHKQNKMFQTLQMTTMQPVTLPRFGSAGQAPPQSAPGGAWATADQQANPNSDPLDFDLLAEYLLDDGNALPGSTATGLPQFDFRYVRINV